MTPARARLVVNDVFLHLSCAWSLRNALNAKTNCDKRSGKRSGSPCASVLSFRRRCPNSTRLCAPAEAAQGAVPFLAVRSSPRIPRRRAFASQDEHLVLGLFGL